MTCRHVYSVTNSRGFTPSTEYFSKEVFSEDLEAYRVVRRRMIAYNPSRINVGSVALQDELPEVVVSPLYVVFSVDESRLLPEYLLAFLKSRPGLAQISFRSTGTVRNSLRFETLCQLEMKLPCIELQRERVGLLAALSKQTDDLKKLRASLDDIVKSEFVEMFGGDRNPVIRASEVLTNFRNGVSPSKMGKVHSDVLTLSSITRGRFDAAARKDGTFVEMPQADKRVSSRDFYICRGNGNKKLVGVAAFAEEDHPDLVFPDTMIAVTVNDSMVCQSYLAYEWAQPNVRRQIESKARTTNGTFKINQKTIAGVQIPLPPLEEQIKFADFVARVDKLRFDSHSNNKISD